MKTIHPWLQRLHEHMLKTGEAYTVRDAVAAFGIPDRNAAKLLHSAAGPHGGGWFKMTEVTLEGRHGAITLYAFKAMEQGKMETHTMPRCNSVWQMAELA